MPHDRALLHLVARPGTDLGPALAGLERVTALLRDPACFMHGHSPHAGAVESTDIALLTEVAHNLEPLIDTARSMAIVGTDHVFIEPAATPVRYQYLMHRRSDFTHAQYLERYRTIHYEFGLRTPNIAGYVQLHVDQDASLELGAATGLAAAPCDSMSELHLESVEHFIDGILAQPEVGTEAQADEERFVDRSRSFGFAHRIVQGSPSC